MLFVYPCKQTYGVIEAVLNFTDLLLLFPFNDPNFPRNNRIVVEGNESIIKWNLKKNIAKKTNRIIEYFINCQPKLFYQNIDLFEIILPALERIIRDSYYSFYYLVKEYKKKFSRYNPIGIIVPQDQVVDAHRRSEGRDLLVAHRAAEGERFPSHP